jgi:site-specific recombinase XerD
VPFFTSVELSGLEKACRGNTFAQRRDAAVIAVFRASGIRLSELAGIRCGDLDLETREIKVFGKGRKERIVKIDYEAARSPPAPAPPSWWCRSCVGDRPGRDLAGRRQ